VISGTVFYYSREMAIKLIWNRSDYRSFASERPEELAQAIQKGIPATLRGMMWQHM